MNRRGFLLAVGAAACGSHDRGRTAPPRARDAGTGAGTGSAATDEPPIVDDWMADEITHVSRRPSPLIARGDEVAFATADGLAWWDTGAMQRVELNQVPYRAVCLLDDNSVLAYTGSELHRYDPRRNLTELGGDVLRVEDAGVVHLARGRTAADAYLGVQRSLVRYRLGERAVEIAAKRELAEALDDQLIAVGDGRLIEAMDHGVRVIAEDGTVRDLPTPDRDPVHLAVVRAGVWTSQLTDRFASRLELATLAVPSVGVSTAALAGRVIHLAAGPGGLAVLVFEPRPPKGAWTIHLLDEQGVERWHAKVDRDPTWPAWALNAAFVALGAHRVLLAVNDRLLAWDAATGAPIAPRKTG